MISELYRTQEEAVRARDWYDRRFYYGEHDEYDRPNIPSRNVIPIQVRAFFAVTAFVREVQ